jgi:beta-aspartyl-peptidase (threonine type)
MRLIDIREVVIPREVDRFKEVKAKIAASGADTTFAGDFSQHTASHDTVGAVALDMNGDIAAATSTGGTVNKTPGRVGDSSLIGCGCYADNLSAAVSCTGWGEPMMKLVLAKWAADKVQAGMQTETAASSAIEYLKSRLNGHGGMIVLDARGNWGIAHNTPRMAWGVRTLAGEHAGLSRG